MPPDPSSTHLAAEMIICSAPVINRQSLETRFTNMATQGGNDQIVGPDHAWFSQLYGDAQYLFEYAQGGNDTITGGAYSHINELYGDAHWMFDNAQGGNDTLYGGAYSDNELHGDSYFLEGNASGGNDTLYGGAHSGNQLIGDATSMYGDSKGGNDTLIGATGADSANALYGDTREMTDNAHGGNDQLFGADYATNWLYGDFRSIGRYNPRSKFGDDILVGGNFAASNLLVGDAEQMYGGFEVACWHAGRGQRYPDRRS